MSEPTRREFIRNTTLVAAAGALAAGPSLAGGAEESTPAEKSAPADRLVIGVIGPGGQGGSLMESFAGMKDVRVAYVCDVDANRAGKAAERVKKISGHDAKVEPDMRRVFDDRAVDAVVIGTPDHWHAPATILACQAGKHVYVEKPASHNIREGRLMIEAARRSSCVVQVGTQSRTTAHIMKAMKLLKEGAIGDVLVAKAWNSQRRGNIGKQQPSDPPEYVDYDAWIGPAPFVPFQRNRFHSVWRWWHAFGTGDAGNDGVHDIDIARWGLGVETHPSRVCAMGGKYFFDDDQQFPDTMYVSYEYPGAAPGGRPKQLVFEQRIWSPYKQETHENGNAFYGTKGMLVLGKHTGWKLYKGNELAQEEKGSVENTPHHRDWLDGIRNNVIVGGSRPNADIEIGHLSSSLSHLGNIATRLGRTLSFDPKAEWFVGDDEANRSVSREYREGHWAVPKGV